MVQKIVSEEEEEVLVQKVTREEMELNSVLPDWASDLYTHTVMGDCIPYSMQRDLKGFDSCVVGSFRERIGLEGLYDDNDHSAYCFECRRSAINFYRAYRGEWIDHGPEDWWRTGPLNPPGSAEMRSDYLEVLSEFLDHMRKGHGWKR